VFIRSCCAVILPLALSVNRKPLVHSGRNLLFTPAWRLFWSAQVSCSPTNSDAGQRDIN
jgi:hypothetical protein